MQIKIRLLGSFEATLDDASIVPTAPKPRQVLAMLALNAGHILSIATLMAEVWGQWPPPSAATTLHTYIGKLRRELEHALGCQSADEVKKILVTEDLGYRLSVPCSDVDTGRYEELASTGRRAAEHDDFGTTAEALSAALELWRGPALSDVAKGSHLAVETVRLQETRLSDLDLRIDADLRLGRYRQLLGELAGLCARYPLSENFHAKYMFALSRSGQRWRALDMFQRLRKTMIEELGIDLSTGMQHLHQAILRGVPSMADLDSGNSEWLMNAAESHCVQSID